MIPPSPLLLLSSSPPLSIVTGGSLLGAVRQHGVLFCDDDIDVSILEQEDQEEQQEEEEKVGGKMGSDGGGCDCNVDGGTGGTSGSGSDTSSSGCTIGCASRRSRRCDEDDGLIEGSTSRSTYERVRRALPRLLGDAFTYTVRPWEGGDKIRMKRMTSVFVDVFTLRRYLGD